MNFSEFLLNSIGINEAFHEETRVIDKKTVSHIANLAKLNLSEDEAAKYAEKISGILGYFEQLAELDTKGVEPMHIPSPIEEAQRQDIATEKKDKQDCLKNAPDRSGNLFKVPRVL